MQGQGANHLELGDLADGSAAVDGAAVHCGHGQRYLTAAGLLRRHGFDSTAATAACPAEIAAALVVR